MKQIGIIGASGYTGVELLRLLSAHPDFQVKVVTADTMAGHRVHELYPSLAIVYPDLSYQTMQPDLMDGLDAVFCALPHGVSQTIVPDLLGFGRSDKPISMETHTYLFHVDAMTELVEQLNLHDVTFFGQDWGGLIGLRVVAENEERFARVAIGNTGCLLYTSPSPRDS